MLCVKKFSLILNSQLLYAMGMLYLTYFEQNNAGQEE